MHGERAGRKWPREIARGWWAGLGTEFGDGRRGGVKDNMRIMKKYGAGSACGRDCRGIPLEGQAGTTRRRLERHGVRPGKGWSPAGIREWSA
jgi:hypothetical protein